MSLQSYDEFKAQVLAITNDEQHEVLFDAKLRQAIRWLERLFDFPYMNVDKVELAGQVDNRFSLVFSVSSTITGLMFRDTGAEIKRVLHIYLTDYADSATGAVLGTPESTAGAFSPGGWKGRLLGELTYIPLERVTPDIWKRVGVPSSGESPKFWTWAANAYNSIDPEQKIDRWNCFTIFPAILPTEVNAIEHGFGIYTTAYRFSSPLPTTAIASKTLSNIAFGQTFPFYPISIADAAAYNNTNKLNFTKHWLFDNANAALEARIITALVPSTRDPEMALLYREILASEIKSLRTTYGNRDLENESERMDYVPVQDVPLTYPPTYE